MTANFNTGGGAGGSALDANHHMLSAKKNKKDRENKEENMNISNQNRRIFFTKGFLRQDHACEACSKGLFSSRRNRIAASVDI